MLSSPTSTVEEREDGTLEYQLRIPVSNGEIMVRMSAQAVQELRGDLDDFLRLVDQRQALDAMVALDSGGH
jgi:hypothetical protein